MTKRICYSVLLAILMVTLGSGFSPAPKAAAVNASLPAEDAAYVPGQLIVGFAPSASLGSMSTRAEGLAQTVGAKVLKSSEQGATLLDVGQGQSVRVMAVQIKRMKGVRYAEPNYIYKEALDPVTEAGAAPPAGAEAGLQTTQAAAAVGAAAASSPYPNDPFLWWNGGWKYVGADIVSPNTTSSKTVCLLDSGVDYTHKDLGSNVIKGYDYVSADSDPMDDYGTGTHMAGIIAAIRNNKEGIAGVSTGKVVAVKVLDSGGIGTAYDIGLGINYCASLSSVSILTLGWTGVWSQTLQDAVNNAIVNKSKLVVAAAGDGNTTDPTHSYPAAFSTGYPTFSYGVVAVAASGAGPSDNIDYKCKYPQSNKGAWITLVAPGAHIYSTTPWDKPFDLNTHQSIKPRYDYMSGTPTAAAFVSAVAARAWGYQPTMNNIMVVQRLKTTGFGLNLMFPGCWDGSMINAREVNVASALDRGAVTLHAEDAVTGSPLVGATVSVYTASGSSLGSAVITPISTIDPITGLVDLKFVDSADVLNLPTTGSPVDTPKISATNYTASAQKAFSGPSSNPDGTFTPISGEFVNGGFAYVPPKTANFTVVGQTDDTYPSLTVWLPTATPYIVGVIYNKAVLGDPTIAPFGSMNEFPYARWMNNALVRLESIGIHNRPSDSSAPYYPGLYQVGMTDGNIYPTGNDLDGENASALVWKDGVIKARVDKGTYQCTDSDHWWFPLQIISPPSGAATYIKTPTNCGTLANAPY